MSDHYHYEYASDRHDHRGQYADERHDHNLDYAERHHRHYDDESTARGLRQDLGRAEERIRELDDGLRDALERIRALEADTPQARQLQLEADLVAGCAETSDGERCGEWHEGGRCGACGLYGPGPACGEVLDEGGPKVNCWLGQDPHDWHEGEFMGAVHRWEHGSHAYQVTGILGDPDEPEEGASDG